MQNVQFYIAQYENNKVYVYIYGTISNLTVNCIKHVMLFIAGFFILNTCLTIMVRGMEHKINK